MVNMAQVYTPTGTVELDYDNNTAEWTTTILAAQDPNAIYVSPTGCVEVGDTSSITSGLVPKLF